MNEKYVRNVVANIMQLEDPEYGLVVIKGSPHFIFEVHARGALLTYVVGEPDCYSPGYYCPQPCGTHHDVKFAVELSSIALAHGDTPLTRAAQVLGEFYGDSEPLVFPTGGISFHCPTA